MKPIHLSREQSRQVDQVAIEEYGMTGLQLMENAGRSLCDMILSLAPRGTLVICCGKGNNGGDGFVAARHLVNRGYAPLVLLWADPEDLQGDAAANYRIVTHGGVAIRVVDRIDAEINAALTDADWIVDALLGTGAHGDPREPLDAAIAAINQSGSQILAVDIPSGLDCDSGTPGDPCIKALHTGTFATSKIGFQNPAAETFTGHVQVLDIGVPMGVVDRIAAKTPG